MDEINVEFVFYFFPNVVIKGSDFKHFRIGHAMKEILKNDDKDDFHEFYVTNDFDFLLKPSANVPMPVGNTKMLLFDRLNAEEPELEKIIVHGFKGQVFKIDLTSEDKETVICQKTYYDGGGNLSFYTEKSTRDDECDMDV